MDRSVVAVGTWSRAHAPGTEHDAGRAGSRGRPPGATHRGPRRRDRSRCQRSSRAIAHVGRCASSAPRSGQGDGSDTSDGVRHIQPVRASDSGDELHGHGSLRAFEWTEKSPQRHHQDRQLAFAAGPGRCWCPSRASTTRSSACAPGSPTSRSSTACPHPATFSEQDCSPHSGKTARDSRRPPKSSVTWALPRSPNRAATRAGCTGASSARKFLPQTFVEWAAQTIPFSFWAGAHYQKQRARGASHQTAVRSLAFKWIRILFRCWKDGTRDDESLYLKTLQTRGSALLTFAAAQSQKS